MDKKIIEKFLEKNVVIRVGNNRKLLGKITQIFEESFCLFNPNFGESYISYSDVRQIREVSK